MTSSAVLEPAPSRADLSLRDVDTPGGPPALERICLPRVRSVVAHCGRYLIVGTLIPMGLFYVLLNNVGLKAALVGVLVWSLGLIGHRTTRARRIETTLVMSTVLMIVRITITWCTGSAVVYLAQPLITTFLTATALLASVALRRPFTERVTRDYVPLPPSISSHSTVRSCFSHASLIFGAAYLLNGSASLWLLLHLSVGQFMVVSKMVGLALTGAALLASLVLFVRTLRKHRIKLRFASA